MDNFRVDITAIGDDLLKKAMEIAFSEYVHAVSYVIDPKKGMIFLWAKANVPGEVMLPFKMDHVAASDFVRRWLAEQDYGREPDIDGDCEKGWQLYNESWGHVNSWYQAFVAVKPAWAMYGK